MPLMTTQRLVVLRESGLYCPPGDFYIDPVRPVARAVITHGHSDHARSGHGAVLATAETLAIMHARMGEGGLYAVCALVFIGLSAPALHRLIIGRRTVLL